MTSDIAFTMADMAQDAAMARDAFADPDVWRKIQQNGMTIDNSWENAARKYVELYEWTRS